MYYPGSGIIFTYFSLHRSRALIFGRLKKVGIIFNAPTVHLFACKVGALEMLSTLVKTIFRWPCAGSFSVCRRLCLLDIKCYICDIVVCISFVLVYAFMNFYSAILYFMFKQLRDTLPVQMVCNM